MRKETNKKKSLAKNNLPAVITPPLTRQELVTQKSRQLEAGEITAYDFAQELRLEDKQFRFVELYTSQENLMDGEHAAMIAYEIDPTEKKAIQKARAIAKRLESHQGVCTLITSLLSSLGWNDENVRKQHIALYEQNADKKMKFMALKLYYEVTGKLKKDQTISVVHSLDPSVLSNEELIMTRNNIYKMEGKQIPGDFTEFEVIA